jgi:hypothetical protein
MCLDLTGGSTTPGALLQIYTCNGAAWQVWARPGSPSITSGPSTTFTEGAKSTYTITSSGYPKPSFTETGSLPTGVTFTDILNGTAVLSGSPASGMEGSYPIIIAAANGVPPSVNQRFTLRVVGRATSTTPTVTPKSVVRGGRVTYKATVSSSSGVPVGSITFTIWGKTMCKASLMSGKASCSSTKAPKGADTVTATYKGSTIYAGSSGSASLKVRA